MFNTPIRSVHPAGGSAAQQTARVNTRNEGYRSQIVSTRQIIKRQQPTLPNQYQGARAEANAGQAYQQKQQQASDRAAHIAVQQIASLQARTPNPRIGLQTAVRQSYDQLHTVSEIGRLTKAASNRSLPLEHRVGALRALRSRYGIPVTQQNYKTFRQAQAFHDFLTNGKEGDTFNVPVVADVGRASGDVTINGHPVKNGRYTQTYQLQKTQNGDFTKLVPVAVDKTGDGFRPSLNVREAISSQSGSVAGPLVNEASTATTLTSKQAASLVPKGTIGTPIRNSVQDLVSLPRDVIDSAYYAASQTAAGHGGQVLHQFLKTDPIALAAQGKLGQAAGEVYRHPLMAALEVAGVRGGLRLAGRVKGITGERAPAVLPGTAMEKQRSYTTSITGNPRQRAVEARKVTAAEKAYAEAHAADASGHYTREQVDAMYQAAAQKDPRIMSNRDIHHVANVHESLGQPLRRRGRAAIQQAMKPLLSKPQEGGHAQRLIVEGISPARRAVSKDYRGPATLLTKEGPREVTVSGHAGPGPDGRLYAKIAESNREVPLDSLRKAPDVAAIRNDLAAYHESLTGEAQTLRANKEGRKLAANEKLRSRIQETLALPDHQLRGLAERSTGISELTNATEAHVVARHGLDEQQALIARVKTYAIRHMGAKVAPETHRLERWQQEADAAKAEGRRVPSKPQAVLTTTENGRAVRLTPQKVLAHMQANGVHPNDVAFVSQRDLTPGAYNRRWSGRDGNRPGLPQAPRTGAAVMQGLIDTHPENLTRNVVRLQQFAAADQNWVASYSDVAARHTDGQIRTFKSKQAGEAWKKDAAYNPDGSRIHGAPKWRLVRANPWHGGEESLQTFLEHGSHDGFVQTAKGLEHPISKSIENAVRADAHGPGEWIAVPDEWAKTIEEHSQVYSSSDPTLRSLTSFFRHTVLPTSLPWLFGNVSEATLRTAIKDPRIRSNVILFRRVLAAIDQMDPEEAARLRDQLGVGHYGMTDVSNTYTSLDQFSGSQIEPLAKVLSDFRHSAGPSQVVDAYGKFTDWVFHSVNARLETPFREAAAGAHIRDVFGTGVLKRVGAEAIQDAAKGLRGTPAQIRLADEVRRIYGQYEAFSPKQRRLIVLYSPFLAWTRNAFHFIFNVLPKDHPVLTALIVANNRMARDWRNQHGLNEWGAAAVPGFLQGSIPVGGGGHVRAQRYSPFGAFSDPGSTLADLVLPQFSGAIHALNGQKWTGQPDPNLQTTDKKVPAAILGMLTSIVPFYGRVQQAIGYTQGSIGNRVLQFPGGLWQTENPLKVVQQKASRSSSSSSGWMPSGGSSGSWSPGTGSSNSWMP